MSKATNEITADAEFDEALDNLHFYATNCIEWATTTDKRNLRDLIKMFDSQKYSYSLYLVPTPWKQSYKIKSFAPQVEGAKEIAFFKFEDGKKVN